MQCEEIPPWFWKRVDALLRLAARVTSGDEDASASQLASQSSATLVTFMKRASKLRYDRFYL